LCQFVARDADRKLQILIRNSFVKSLSILIAFFILLTFLPSSGLAQTSNDPWSEPINISHSGAASDPVMVVDAKGTVHLIWLDQFSGPMYTKGDGNNWDLPVPVSPPFGSLNAGAQAPTLTRPILIADSSGIIHAFWKDDKNRLFYSHIAASGFAASQWSESAILDDSAVDLSVATDSGDRLHLSYVRTKDTPDVPAGIYYRQSSDQGDIWSAPALLYQSLYLRTLSEQNAHVQVATTDVGDGQSVYVAWDNRPRGQVFWIESKDGGSSWGEPQEVGKAEGSAGGTAPSNLDVYARGEKVLRLWQSGQPEAGCTQNYQWSLDGGATWQPQQHITSGSLSCPQGIQIMDGNNGPVLIVTSDQMYLLAWDGTQWSDPQAQLPLASFIDPETGQTVDFDYRQAHLNAGLDLFVVGSEKSGEGDIWWLRRSMTDVLTWFPQELVWSPVTLATRQASRFLSLALVADAGGLVHVFWSQTNDADLSKPDSAIYYARWEEERLWSQPVAILNSPEEPVDQPAVALDSAGDLLLVWRRGQEGEIAFSRANANQAALPETWSQPQVLSNPQRSASSPGILADREGSIYVVYAVPINEGRGIYLTQSEDGGQTWSDPTQVFDAASAGWVMLDQPRLALTGNGVLHLLWTRYALRSDQPEPLALFYARSQDDGKTWTAPEPVVENPVAWSRILGVGENTVFRFWQESTAGQTTTLWHERSLDNGQTWERIAPISIFGEAVGGPSLAWDGIGELNLLQVVSRSIGKYTLLHWIWDGERWGNGGSLLLDIEQDTILNNLASAISPQGYLSVVLSARVLDQALEPHGDELLFTERSVELPEGQPTPSPPVPAAPAVTLLPKLEPTAQPTRTPTPDLADLISTVGSGNTSSSSWYGLIFGGVLAGIIVSIIFGVRVWKAMKS
jgi:hypothetical protein